MSRHLALPMLICGAVLSGCANLAPPFERPQPALRSDFGTAAAVPASSALPQPTWREFITDDRLRQAIAASLSGSRDLRIAALNVERARALYRIQDASQPQLDASAVASRQRNGTGTSSQFSVQLGLASYEIDFFRRLGNLSESALASFLAEQENRNSVQTILVAEVAGAWLTLAADMQRLELARTTLSSQQASFELTRRARELGGSSGLVVARAQTTVDTARSEVARYSAQVAQDRHALELLIGQPLDAAWLPDGATAATVTATATATATTTTAVSPPSSLLVEVPAGLPSEVLLRRPDVRAAEQVLRAANADLGAARAALYPSIRLTAAAGTQSNSLSGLFQGSSGVFSLVPRLDLPIFDGGQRRANVELGTASQAIAVASYERTVQAAFREVADALALRGTLAEQFAAQQSLVEATRRSLVLSEALFRQGASSYLDVLDAQRSLYAAQQSLISLQLAERGNRIALYRALGGS